MNTAHVFDAASLPLTGLRLIEASAGTGKTFSLAGLYLRLIVDEGVCVRDILVMTFTRAATQELRERIRARLAMAARIAHTPATARDGHPEDVFTQTLLARSHEDPSALARRLADAAARVDEATIVTIHGFAQRAASENAFESALAFDRGEAIDDMTVYAEATADYWRQRVFGKTAGAANMLAFWSSPDALLDALSEVFRRRHAQLIGIDHQRIETLVARLAARWPAQREPMAAALTEAVAADALRKNEPLNQGLSEYETPADAVADLDTRISDALAGDRLPALPAWVTVFADVAAQFKTRPKACLTYAEPLAGLDVLAVLAELQPLARRVALQSAAEAISVRAAERKIAWRQYSYDDLIVALHAALTDPRTGNTLADALHARWPYALVDEFQDTDPLQYASLSRIYLERPRKTGALLLIGDPKQAIYGFRGGDIYAYLDAARAAGDARYTLTRNFRSTSGMLVAIEALYQLPPKNPFLVADIDFPHVDAGRPPGDRRLLDGNDNEQPALTVWQLVGAEQQQKNGRTKNPPKADDTARLVNETVAAIAGLLAGTDLYWQLQDTRRPVAAQDIAVLVNNHREAAELQAALAEHGIRAVCQHRESVYASGEAADLTRILRAMAAPDDAAAVRAAQPTALIGRRLSDLVALADDDSAMQAAIERFQTLHEAWRRRGVLAALETLFIERAPALLALTDGERRMSNYLQLGELLAQAEGECFGMASLVHWLDTQITAAAEGRLGSEDESQLRLESDADLVRISTVHAAKGLEYAIVFMPFSPWLGTWSDRNRPDRPPLVFHPQDDNASGHAVIDLVGEEPAHREQAVLEARAEALRLFYVAATRAKQALFIAWREPDDTGTSGALADLFYREGPTDGHALSRLCAAAGHHVGVRRIDVTEARPAIPGLPAVDSQALNPARQNLPVARLRWSTYSFSRLAHAPVIDPTDDANAELPVPGAEDELAGAGDAPAPEEDDAPVPRLDARLSGVRFGSAVHDLLETELKTVDTRWPAPGQPPDTASRQRVYAGLRQYGLIEETEHDPRIDDTADLVARTLHTPLPGIGALVDLSPVCLLTEMEFMLRLRGHKLGALVDTLRADGYLPAALGGHPQQTLFGLMQGFIDLVIEVDGRYYIIDYKTNRLGDTASAYTRKALSRAMARTHYDLQYLIYTVALHRHLAQRLPGYDPATHLGGVQYLFVRAMDGQSRAGVFTDRPDIALIERLDRLFDGHSVAA